MLSHSEMAAIFKNIKRIEHQNVPVSKILRAPVDYENPRDNTKAIPIVAKSLRSFGYVKTAITVDEKWEILTGDTTYQAHIWNASLRDNEPGLPEDEYILAENRLDGPDWNVVVEVTQVLNMPVWMKRAYRIADNKSQEYANWKPDMVIRDIEFIMSMGIKPDATGFEPRELSLLVKSVPVLNVVNERDVSPVNERSIEDFEGASGERDEEGDEEYPAGDDETHDSGESSWVVHMAFSTKEAAEEFARSNGFDLKFPPNSRMLSIDVSDVD